MAHQANKCYCTCDLIVGDHAWLPTEDLPLVSGLSRKLSSRFIGPYKVIKQINPVILSWCFLFLSICIQFFAVLS